MSKFEDMTVAELKNIARSIGLTGYSKMRKQELSDAIRAAECDEMAQDMNGSEIDDVLETVDDMTGFPDEQEQENVSHGPSAEAVAEAQEAFSVVQTASVGRLVQPEAFPVFANRAMRRKAAYRAKLAMRHARRNGRHTLISEADWEFAEKVSA